MKKTDTFLEFGSITYTQRAAALLSRAQIRHRLARSGISNCSYGLWIGSDDAERVKNLLDGAGMRYRG